MREILVSSSSDHSFFYQMQPLASSCRSCNQLAEAEAVLSAYSSSLEYYQKKNYFYISLPYSLAQRLNHSRKSRSLVYRKVGENSLMLIYSR